LWLFRQKSLDTPVLYLRTNCVHVIDDKLSVMSEKFNLRHNM